MRTPYNTPSQSPTGSYEKGGRMKEKDETLLYIEEHLLNSNNGKFSEKVNLELIYYALTDLMKEIDKKIEKAINEHYSNDHVDWSDW